MIRTWHITISGFTQTESRMHGCQRLWLELMDLASPQTCVIQPPWDHNWEALASRIANTSANDVRIIVYGYSWGCGNGVVNLAKALKSRAMVINHAVLSDPVYYSQHFSSWPWWTGIGPLVRGIGVLRRGTIKLPSNIRRVDWFRQTNGLPYGCDLKAENPQTQKINEPTILDLPHEAMDDASEWHARCLAVAGLVT